MASTDIDAIGRELGREECEFFEVKMQPGIRSLFIETARGMEDRRYEKILQTTRNVPLHMLQSDKKSPVSLPCPCRTAEDWFCASSSKSKEEWRKMSEVEKQPWLLKAAEDKNRYDKETKEYEELKKVIPLTRSEAFLRLQKWHTDVNAVVHQFEPKIGQIVVDFSAKLQQITSRAISSLPVNERERGKVNSKAASLR